MSSPSPLDFTMEESATGVGVKLALGGDLDVVAAERVVVALARLLAADGPVLIDLTEVVFMDSSGLAAIIRSPRSDEQRERIRLRTSRHLQPQRLLQLTGALDFFSSSPEVATQDGASPA